MRNVRSDTWGTQISGGEGEEQIPHAVRAREDKLSNHTPTAKLIPVKLGENKGFIRERCSPAHAEPGWRAQL